MKKVVLYILVSATLFSTMEIVLKTVGAQLDEFQLTFIRFLIGGLFLLPFAIKEIKKYQTVITKKDMLHMLSMGIVCICISMILFQLGVENSKASTAAVIFCINPMFTMLFAHFMTEEKLNKTKAAALAFGLLGIVFMINPFNMEPGNTPLGVLYIVLAAATFGFYSVMGKKSIHRLRGITQTSISFILGTAVLLPILLLLQRPVFAGITTDNIGMILYIGIMITGLGYLTYFLSMEASDAATASIVFFVKPALAPIFAVIVLHEVISISGLLGILLILTGSYISLREQKSKMMIKDDIE
ncbi:MAG: DMT family transporter [Eubacteriales bacterium]|nr:DMT family transporter [Eubacteriales bacterium]MDD3199692.1 DMT family transporter [Eubacteriales bacterium]MDD4629094.1 DMT family transporter [Eubacteriales bacterium]